MGVSRGTIWAYKEHAEKMKGKFITNTTAKTVGMMSYFSEYSPYQAKGEKNNRLQGVWALSRAGTASCIQSTALCEVFFIRLDQKTRMSSNAGCYITQLDSSQSLIHFSAYLYAFRSRNLTTLVQRQAGTQTRLMNNRRKDAAQPLRKKEWRRMLCVEGFSEWDLDQSSTCCWHIVEGMKYTKAAQGVIML